ncbi:MAG: DEAD/DEAH box helicase family protein [Luteolibacter sp.]|uniref:TOTE conflict system archaeo-eukaryotic primase domain-containing protein n=1 Tax=Luteolibacter sp. TaxID=1962973 RepID=UPI003264EBBE
MTADEKIVLLQKIEAELRELDSRREALIRERGLLLAEQQLEKETVVTADFSPAEKIDIFLSLFRCRADVYPKLWENEKSGRKGYSPVCRNEWFRGVCEKPRVKCSDCPHQAFPPLDESVARDHLTGKAVIGTYAIRSDNICVFLAADFDGDGWREDIRAYRDAARELGVEVAVERSRSGNGGHAWIFFNEPVPALMARRLGTLIVAKASAIHPAMSLASYDRFFPNQDTLPAGGFGNLIALPLQAKSRDLGNSVFLDEDFAPHPDQWAFLSRVPRIDREHLEDLLDHNVPAGVDDDPQLAPRYEDRVLDVIPAAVKRGDFTGSVKAVRRAQLEIPISNLPVSLVAALKRLATLANPVFFEKQRLRFGTYNSPRFIFCGEIHADRLILPRGVVSAAEELFRKAGGRLEIVDKRPDAGRCDFEFKGKLTADQQTAVDAMSLHDDGILLAPPGAGKTVMACAMIAARKVPTLILVHRKTLLDQWVSRIGQFLGLEKKQIGALSANGTSGTPSIVIGMIQTLVKAANPEAMFAPFTQVIIDECHHVPAASFEAVMKTCTARHFLGLTATPDRKDGLQKILFLQCGPIRHRLEMPPDPSIKRTLVLRDIHLDLPLEDLRMPVHELWGLLAEHEGRNRIIAADIAEALRQKRCCAVLSDRKEHLVTLERLLVEGSAGSTERVFRIDGNMGKKTRAAALLGIAGLAAEGGGFALLATSSLVGEGFDLPQLDTLFLTLPVSFKGRIIQYAGRLHRASEDKSEVRIYDYAEPEQPLTTFMRRKRMIAYRNMGYIVKAADEEASADSRPDRQR